MPSIGRAELNILINEADVAVRRLVRRSRLTYHDTEDARQELLADIIARLPAFDARRGTLGAFAGTIFGHKASRIASLVRRERKIFGLTPVSTDQPVSDADGPTTILCDLIPESAGYAAFLGQRANESDKTELQLSIQTALARLSTEDRHLCNALSEATMQGLVRSGFGKRSTLYRHLERVRLDLVALGVGAV